MFDYALKWDYNRALRLEVKVWNLRVCSKNVLKLFV